MTSNWFKKTIENIEKTNVLTETSIDTGRFITCFYKNYEEIYSIIGGDNFITQQLKEDIKISIEKIGKFYEQSPDANKTFDAIIENELKRKNNYLWACENDQNSPCIGILWCYRAFSAFYTFIENLSWDEMSSKECANETYNNILKPYHKWSTRLIASTVIQFIPDRDLILENINLPPTIQGYRLIETFLSKMHPIIERMREIINRHNIHFTSKV
jgi:hypothetical protein